MIFIKLHFVNFVYKINKYSIYCIFITNYKYNVIEIVDISFDFVFFANNAIFILFENATFFSLSTFFRYLFTKIDGFFTINIRFFLVNLDSIENEMLISVFLSICSLRLWICDSYINYFLYLLISTIIFIFQYIEYKNDTSKRPLSIYLLFKCVKNLLFVINTRKQKE